MPNNKFCNEGEGKIGAFKLQNKIVVEHKTAARINDDHLMLQKVKQKQQIAQQKRTEQRIREIFSLNTTNRTSTVPDNKCYNEGERKSDAFKLQNKIVVEHKTATRINDDHLMLQKVKQKQQIAQQKRTEQRIREIFFLWALFA
jgi:hypothetical protein